MQNPKRLFEVSKLAKLMFERGGLLPKRLYEVYGESGTGKTQLAIQLLLNVSLYLITWLGCAA